MFWTYTIFFIFIGSLGLGLYTDSTEAVAGAAVAFILWVASVFESGNDNDL
jgi:hypothetical protein